MDLFRHCTQLGFHQYSSIGYANFVCSVLDQKDYSKIPKFEYTIEKMYAIPLALDEINWHVMNDVDASFEAFCFVGYLSSCRGLWNKSIQAYEKASALAEGSKRDKCLTDLGYCYLKVSKNSDASRAFLAVKEATFTSTVGLALAYYKGKNIYSIMSLLLFKRLLFSASQYQSCYETYQKSLDWLAKSDEEKAVVLVAISAMIYAFQGVDGAKNVLFQW